MFDFIQELLKILEEVILIFFMHSFQFHAIEAFASLSNARFYGGVFAIRTRDCVEIPVKSRR